MLKLPQMEADLEGERITKMEHTLANHDFGKKDVNVDIAIKQTSKSNKCSQCNNASSHAGYLRQHLKTY